MAWRCLLSPPRSRSRPPSGAYVCTCVVVANQTDPSTDFEDFARPGLLGKPSKHMTAGKSAAARQVPAPLSSVQGSGRIEPMTYKSLDQPLASQPLHAYKYSKTWL